jgi:chlorite dismutase
VDPVAHPPETVEGWYALHQLFAIPPAAAVNAEHRASALTALRELACPADGGWTAVVPLIGSRADVMVLHFRPTLDALGEAQRRLQREPFFQSLTLVYSFLSVTEAGLYHITAQLAKAAAERGGEVGDAEYRNALAERVKAETASPHVQRRLYPVVPPEMPYVCF